MGRLVGQDWIKYDWNSTAKTLIAWLDFHKWDLILFLNEQESRDRIPSKAMNFLLSNTFLLLGTHRTRIAHCHHTVCGHLAWSWAHIYPIFPFNEATNLFFFVFLFFLKWAKLSFAENLTRVNVYLLDILNVTQCALV